MPLLNVSRLPGCPECLAGFDAVRGKICSVCGDRVLSSHAETGTDGLRRRPVCRRGGRPFERAAAYGSYDGGLRELIHLLKYNGVHPVANVPGRMLAEVLTTLEPAFEHARFERTMFEQAPVLAIPVPLYKAKRRQCGFNRTELIARNARKFYPAEERKHAPGVLRRTRDRSSQIGLTSHQRSANLRGAFAVPRAAEVTGREVLLVDDVYTSGATAAECARVLRRAGASQVWVATVARTPRSASNYGESTQGFEGSAVPVFELEALKLGQPETMKL